MCYHAWRYVKDRSTAEDIVQDVFFKLWKKMQHNELKKNLDIKPYLYVAVKNTALNKLKVNKRRADLEEKSLTPLFVETMTAADILIYNELKNHLMNAITDLPPKCREVFQLSRLENMSYKEISEQMNISIKTVENQMGKALRRLRESLGKYQK